MFGKLRATFNIEANSGAILAINHDVGKRRRTNDFDADGRQKTTRNRNGFYRLVHRTRADRLNFYARKVTISTIPSSSLHAARFQNALACASFYDV